MHDVNVKPQFVTYVYDEKLDLNLVQVHVHQESKTTRLWIISILKIGMMSRSKILQNILGTINAKTIDSQIHLIHFIGKIFL